MEMFKKIMKIVTTIVPQTAITISKPKGSYVVAVKRTWLGNESVITITCKEAVRLELSLLDLI
jgi:hypothetical protein